MGTSIRSMTIIRLNCVSKIIILWGSAKIHIPSKMSSFIMNIYNNNCTVSELQHFVTQPLILPIVRVVKLIVGHAHTQNRNSKSQCYFSLWYAVNSIIAFNFSYNHKFSCCVYFPKNNSSLKSSKKNRVHVSLAQLLSITYILYYNYWKT